jgi:PAS domain S-box-containing protein
MLDIIPVVRNVVMEYMSDGVIVLDHKNRVIDFNAAAQSLFGDILSKSVGQPVVDVLSMIPTLAGCCQKKSVEHSELTLPVKDKQRILDLRFSLFRDRWGKTRGKLMIWRDITEKKEAEIRIQKSEERHRAVTQLANDAIVLMDTQWKVVSWNKRAQKIFGYAEKEILGQPVTRLMPDRYKKMHQEGVERLYSGGEPRVIDQDKTLEFAGLKKDGSQLPLEFSLASWEAGGETFFSAIIRDITDRKQAEAAQHRYAMELETQNAELDAFAHTVAHDLKKPLTELIGFCSLLKIHFTETLTEDRKGYLKKIERSAFKMGSIIDELLLLASVRDMREIETSALKMGAIVAETQIRLENMIKEYHADILLPESWPVAKGYQPWIEEVWMNYFSNAIKYGGQPPRIQVGAIEKEGQIRFWIQDNGNGLSPEEQKRLFTSFERLHQVSVEGHGLGLSIVRRIIEKLGGQVGVESKKGRGSVFYFTLPV